MPSREHPAEALDADNPQAGVLSTAASTSVAQADEELAQAEARAEAARARAIRLRQQAAAASSGHSNLTGAQEIGGDGELQRSARSGRLWRLHRPSRKALAGAAAIVSICVSLTASGYVVWQHHNVVQQRQRTTEFCTAAHNAVVTMMSIDASKARHDVQRFIDDTTGQFKADMLMSAESFVKAVEQSKVNTTAAVQAVAVESMTKDSAVVLVAAKSELTKPDQAKPESRSWRVVVNLQRDDGQLKVSRVEFVP